MFENWYLVKFTKKMIILATPVPLVEWLALVPMDLATGVRYPWLAGHIGPIWNMSLVKYLSFLSVRARVLMYPEKGMACQCDWNNFVKDTYCSYELLVSLNQLIPSPFRSFKDVDVISKTVNRRAFLSEFSNF